MARTARNDERVGLHFLQEIWGIVFLAVGTFFILSLISYSPTDPALNSVSNVEQIGNLCGIIGAYTADVLLTIFGISAYISAILFFLLALLQFLGREVAFRFRDLLFSAGLIIFTSSLIHLRFESIQVAGETIAGGGVIGGLIGEVLESYFNRAGAYVITSAGTLLFFLLTTRLTLRGITIGLKTGIIWTAVTTWKALVGFGDQLPAVGKALATSAHDLFSFIPRGIKKCFGWFHRAEGDEETTEVRIERPMQPPALSTDSA